MVDPDIRWRVEREREAVRSLILLAGRQTKLIAAQRDSVVVKYLGRSDWLKDQKESRRRTQIPFHIRQLMKYPDSAGWVQFQGLRKMVARLVLKPQTHLRGLLVRRLEENTEWLGRL